LEPLPSAAEARRALPAKLADTNPYPPSGSAVFFEPSNRQARSPSVLDTRPPSKLRTDPKRRADDVAPPRDPLGMASRSQCQTRDKAESNRKQQFLHRTVLREQCQERICRMPSGLQSPPAANQNLAGSSKQDMPTANH